MSQSSDADRELSQNNPLFQPAAFEFESTNASTNATSNSNLPAGRRKASGLTPTLFGQLNESPNIGQHQASPSRIAAYAESAAESNRAASYDIISVPTSIESATPAGSAEAFTVFTSQAMQFRRQRVGGVPLGQDRPAPRENMTWHGLPPVRLVLPANQMKLGITPSTQSLEANSPVSRRPEQAPIERATILLSRLPVSEKERRLTNYRRWMLAFSVVDAFMTLLLNLVPSIRISDFGLDAAVDGRQILSCVCNLFIIGLGLVAVFRALFWHLVMFDIVMSINIIITFLHVRSAASVSTLLCHIALMLIAAKCKECELSQYHEPRI